MKAENLKSSNVIKILYKIILIFYGVGAEILKCMFYVSFGKQPPGFNKSFTKLMFIYFIDNITARIIIFLFSLFLLLNNSQHIKL